MRFSSTNVGTGNTASVILDAMKLVELEERLARYAHEKGLIALYLFGSAARGETSKLSDIDVAVLLPEDVKDYFDTRLQMTLDLMSLLSADKIDLVILNQAPPLLKYQVVTGGKVLHSRDDKARQRFENRAILEYLDFKPILELRFEYLKSRLEEGTFGVRPSYRSRTAEED